MSTKVLILLGDAGGGHMSAAKALEAVLRQADSSVEVTIHNLSESQKSFPFNATDSSWKLVSRYPTLEFISNTAYDVTNSEDGAYMAKTLVVQMGKKVVTQVIRKYEPDIVISTHFIVSAILENVKRKFPGIHTATVVSDLVGFPRMMADKTADLIFCPTEGAVTRMQRFGVKPQNIRYPFFPLKPEIAPNVERDEFIKSIGLDPAKKTILVTGGGVGTISMLDVIEEILTNQKYQVIVMCGKSKIAVETLQEKFPNNPNLNLQQFVSNFQDFVCACDLVVSKPGPATIVEIEILGKPTIYSRIVGKQEHGNIEFLKQNPNFVYQPDSGKTYTELIERLLAQPPTAFAPRFTNETTLEMAKMILALHK